MATPTWTWKQTHSIVMGFVFTVLLVNSLGCMERQAEEIEVGESSRILPSTTSEGSVDKVITLAADVWLPYNGVPGSEKPGFMIEIAKYAFEREGYRVHYRIVPWARAIQGTREGTYDGIVGTGRQETPDFAFPECELGLARHTFFVRQGTAWRFEGLDSLDSISLGVIRNYSYGTLFDDYIQQHQDDRKRVQVVGGETGLSQNIAKLSSGRVDAIIEDEWVFRYHLLRTGTPDDFENAGVYCDEEVYIAFSPTRKEAPAYARLLTRALRKLRASGQLTVILEKYGVQDWRD